MPGPQVDKLHERISQAMSRFSSLDAAVESVREELDTLSPGLAIMLQAEIEEAKMLVALQFEQVEILHRYSVIRKRPQWYFGPKPSDLHWPAVRGYLLNGVGWHKDDVELINEASSEACAVAGCPARRGIHRAGARGACQEAGSAKRSQERRRGEQKSSQQGGRQEFPRLACGQEQLEETSCDR